MIFCVAFACVLLPGHTHWLVAHDPAASDAVGLNFKSSGKNTTSIGHLLSTIDFKNVSIICCWAGCKGQISMMTIRASFFHTLKQ